MNFDRREQLSEFRSKVTRAQMRSLHSKFDIPKEYKLEAPAESSPVYCHGEERAPLYIKHLECGLRLPLHPFLRKVFRELGVSPMQMKPNSIAILVGFTVICSWLGIQPKVSVLSHLVGVTVQKTAHYHLQMSGEFKIILELPTSNKGWKDKFVWVTGDDSNLGCSFWPEIMREALEPRPLPEDERQELKQILQYTGPRKMSALLDRSVLRLHGISSVTPSRHDESRAHNITFGGQAGRMVTSGPAPEEEASEESEGKSSQQAKRQRRESPPKQGLLVRGGTDAAVANRGKATVATAPSGAGFWRTRQKKVSHGPRGARRLGESVDNPMEAGSSESEEWGDDLWPAEAEEEDVGSPAPDVDLRALGAETPEGNKGRAGQGVADSHAASSRELPCRPGKESAAGRGASFTPAGWPSPYHTAETDGDWKKVSDLMIGVLPTYDRFEGRPDAEHQYRPAEGMDVRGSVLRSLHLQAKAVEQFNLPEDQEILKIIPDVGLHAILRSYLSRGCLVERELYSRLAQGHHAYEKLRKKHMTSGASGGGEFDSVIKELSLKESELDDWRREMKVKERTIAELKTSSAKMSSEIRELRQRLSDGGDGSQPTRKIYEERDLAVAQVALEQQIAQHAKAQLERESIVNRQLLEEQTRLKESLGRAEERIRHLESSDHRSAMIEESRPAVIEEFRHGPLGKIEVALACKAGSDFIIKQLPGEYQDLPSRLQYPPSIAGQINLLTRFEEAGAGYDLGESGAKEGEEVETESSADNSSSVADQD